MRMLTLLLPLLAISSAAVDSWTIDAGALASDAAMKLAIEDLVASARDLGIAIVPDATSSSTNCVRVTAPAEPPGDPARAQSFSITTSADKRTINISGASTIGSVYGVYWLRDRMLVAHEMPEINDERSPRLPIRFGGGTTKEAIRNALRNTATWVWGTDINQLVPWDSEPEATDNASNRADARALIEYAHALHLKYLVYCDEISYHPSLLQAAAASRSPADPALWNMLQSKYRLLLDALPEVDGVRIRTGEHSRVSPPYVPYDVMHDPPLDTWPLEDRYRTFIQKVHQVVVGEFGKIYYHRTWIPDPNEQHSRADVYRAIFTEAVPTNNLFLSPYLTASDRWFYQPFNPTFNQTPHQMVVLLAAMDYHAQAGVEVFPVYPGDYFFEGMQRIVNHSSSNVIGADMGTTVNPGQSTAFITDYLAFRLAWNPNDTPQEVARDIAAKLYGPAAAETVAEILMLSADAYRDGLYIKPVAEKLRGNTLPQLRLTTFPVRGFPDIDGGKAHVAWARTAIFEPSAGAIDEAIVLLDRGLATAIRMEELGHIAADAIRDAATSHQLQDMLALTRTLIATNNRYVKTIYAYFPYVDDPTPEHREHLAGAVAQLEAAVAAFQAAPGFAYKLYGVEQMLTNARSALEDPQRANQQLQNAPDEADVEGLVVAQLKRNDEVLAAHRENATKILHWSGMIDGKDILHIRGDAAELQHIAADEPHTVTAEHEAPLPAMPVTVLVETIESGDWRPFVLHQPSEANGWTASIYMFDPGIGYGRREFNVYYVEKAPSDLALESLGVDP